MWLFYNSWIINIPRHIAFCVRKQSNWLLMKVGLTRSRTAEKKPKSEFNINRVDWPTLIDKRLARDIFLLRLVATGTFKVVGDKPMLRFVINTTQPYLILFCLNPHALSILIPSLAFFLFLFFFCFSSKTTKKHGSCALSHEIPNEKWC